MKQTNTILYENCISCGGGLEDTGEGETSIILHVADDAISDFRGVFEMCFTCWTALEEKRKRA